MLNCTSQILKSTRCDEFNVREQSNISYSMFKKVNTRKYNENRTWMTLNA